jgi:hypothetical protein
MNSDKAERNIKAFMDKYGVEGFIKLYFSKYLFKIIKSELKSKLGPDLSKDPATIFYYKDNKIEKLSDIEKYEDEIFEECKKRAGEIINELKGDSKFDNLFAGKFESLNDKKIQNRFEKELHKIMEEWKEGSNP